MFSNIKKFTTTFLLILSFLALNAHSPKPQYHLIIDTDGALDDFRAINFLLAANDVRILAFVASYGSQSAATNAQNLYELLSDCHNEGIPIAINNNFKIQLPPWSNYLSQIKWGNQLPKIDFPDYSTLLPYYFEKYNSKITLVALGSLNTFASLLKQNPKYIDKIEKIIWYNDLNLKDGYNYQIDTSSYKYIVQTGVKLTIVANNRNDLLYNKMLADELKKSKSVYSQKIYKLHQNILNTANHAHFVMWDDLVALFIANPMIFDVKTDETITYCTLPKNIPFEIIVKTFVELLNSSYQPNNRVFLNFPIDDNIYKPQIANNIKKTIDRYGINEWKAITMTNEIHGHTGIYSIVGAKMGIRALEYFNVGVNNLVVTTYTGYTPPLSCFNDGIQISTGATIGQGLIFIADTIIKIPTAVFEFCNQKVKISLKKDISEKIENEVAYAVATFGLTSPLYWNYIEQIALDIWFNYSRHDIFEIQKL